MNLLLVMIGGAFGAGARHLVGRATLSALGAGWPWGTMAVNILGGFAMGVLVGTLARIGAGAGAGEQWRLLLGVGVLGGFTTFSSFSLDTMAMIERGAWVPALGYVLVSVLGALGALALGLALTRMGATTA